MKVAFFGSYFFLIPSLLEKFDFVDVYVDEQSFDDFASSDCYRSILEPSGRLKLFLLPRRCQISSIISFYEIGFSASFRRIFKAKDIEKFKYLFNLHPGPVSLARGRHPLPCAVKYGHPYIGITMHQITNEDIDAGPILLEWKLAMPDLKYQDLDQIIQQMSSACFDVALDLICKTFPNIVCAANNPSGDSYYSPMTSIELAAIINPNT